MQNIRIYLKCLLIPCFLAFAFLGSKSEASEGDYVREILIKYKDKEKIEVLGLNNNEDMGKRLGEIRALKNVSYAEPNYLYKAAVIPSDTFFDNQWYLNKVKAPAAWDKKRDALDVTIAILDTGVQTEHTDLKDNIWRNPGEIPGNGLDDDANGFIDDVNGWDFANNTADPNPKFKKGYTQDGIIHGTVVAGLAGGFGNNGVGISGVAWQTKIMPVKVLNDAGEGDTFKVIEGIDYAIKNKADIINLSFVGFGYSQSLESAIRRAYDAGILVVAAAGNDQGDGEGVDLDERAMYPACLDGVKGENMVLGISATDGLDQKAPFSSYGKTCVDLAAPGVSVFSTSVYSPGHNTPDYSFNKKYDGFWSGTSMAAPIVSGAAALIISSNPRLGLSGVKDIIIKNTDNIDLLNPDFVGQLGSGRLDVKASVDQALGKLNIQNNLLLEAPEKGKEPLVKVSQYKGKEETHFLAFGEKMRSGVNLAAGDVDGDGETEIIAVPGAGGGPQVRIFKQNGRLLGQFFVFNKDFHGGVNIAAGDVNGDGQDEIIVGQGKGGSPLVRIYKGNGRLVGQFFAYSQSFRGGVNLASGDTDGDGLAETITGTGQGGGPQVRIFSKDGAIKGQFFAFNKNSRNGIKVLAAYTNKGIRGNRANIAIAEAGNSLPEVRIYDSKGMLKGSFYAFQKKFQGEINLAAADFDFDGLDEIVTAAGPGGSPHVRVFSSEGVLKSSFFAFESGFSGGVSVTTGDFR